MQCGKWIYAFHTFDFFLVKIIHAMWQLDISLLHLWFFVVHNYSRNTANEYIRFADPTSCRIPNFKTLDKNKKPYNTNINANPQFIGQATEKPPLLTHVKKLTARARQRKCGEMDRKTNRAIHRVRKIIIILS